MSKRRGYNRLNFQAPKKRDAENSLGYIMDKIEEDGLMDELCNTIAALAYKDCSKQEMLDYLRKKFPTYMRNLSLETFNKWLESSPEIAKSYAFSREVSLGKLVNLAIKRAENSVQYPKDDFILKLLDRLDDGSISGKKEPVINESVKQTIEYSKQTSNTFNKLLAEASRFGGFNEIEPDEEEDEEE